MITYLNRGSRHRKQLTHKIIAIANNLPLKVVLRVLWSTKYLWPSSVYLISQPGGSGACFIMLQANQNINTNLTPMVDILTKYVGPPTVSFYSCGSQNMVYR